MICYKKQKEAGTEPLSEQQFYRLLRSKRWNNNIDLFRQTGKISYKESLPCICFQATFDVSSRAIRDKKTKKVIGHEEGRWNLQKYANLTGLVVLDIDKIENPEELINGKLKTEDGKLVAREEWVAQHHYPLSTIHSALKRILLVFVTPSGKGLKIVFKANIEWGNLADNQREMAKLLGFDADESGKDASRTAFICKESDILFINNELFTYEDKAFYEKYNAQYRAGNSKPTRNNPVPNKKDRPDAAKSGEVAAEQVEKPVSTASDMWRGYPLQAIIDQRFAGGIPDGQDIKRHDSCLRLASDLLAMLDADKSKVLEVLHAQSWVKDIVAERNEDIEKMVDDAYEYNRNQVQEHLWVYPSKEMQEAVREVTGLSYIQIVRGNKTEAACAEDEMSQQLWQWGRQIEALFPHYPLLRDICKGLKKNQYPAALFVAGSMMMTLMTRCTYRFYHRPEQLRRLNCQTLIIGDPASGKSFATRLDELLTMPIKKADDARVVSINDYRELLRTKGANKDKPQKPKVPIRLHPSKTSNAQFIQDMINSKEIVDGKETQLHLYTFDSEYDNTLENDKSGAWMKKTGMELKAFHNEEDGQAYSNADSVYGSFKVMWNFVYTGTPIALHKKINERNIGTGLATRLTCIPLPSTNFEMIERVTAIDYDSDRRLEEWAFLLDRTKGELPIQQIVDVLYDWTARRMEEAAFNNSKADEMLLKRCAYHGINFSSPYIVMRHWNEMKEDGNFWQVNFQTDEVDCQLAELLVNIQYNCQRYFFGAMAESYFDNQSKEKVAYSPRKQKSMTCFSNLPTEFTFKDVMRVFDQSNDSARKTISRLNGDKLIEKTGSIVEDGHTISTYKKLIVTTQP